MKPRISAVVQQAPQPVGAPRRAATGIRAPIGSLEVAASQDADAVAAAALEFLPSGWVAAPGGAYTLGVLRAGDGRRWVLLYLMEFAIWYWRPDDAPLHSRWYQITEDNAADFALDPALVAQLRADVAALAP